MPKGSGVYDNRLRWLKMIRQSPTDTGDEQEVYQHYGYLWCQVEEQNGRSGEDYGAEESGTDARIHLQRPFKADPALQVAALDVLQDEYTGYLWHVESGHNEDAKLILDVKRFDVLRFIEITPFVGVSKEAKWNTVNT